MKAALLVQKIGTLLTTMALSLVVGTGIANSDEGGINWLVTVNNPTGSTVVVHVYYDLGFNMKYAKIEPGGFYQFQLGAHCPNGISGSFADGWPLMGTDMYGTWYHGEARLGAVSCGHHTFKICNMPDSYKGMEKYSFCKQ